MFWWPFVLECMELDGVTVVCRCFLRNRKIHHHVSCLCFWIIYEYIYIYDISIIIYFCLIHIDARHTRCAETPAMLSLVERYGFSVSEHCAFAHPEAYGITKLSLKERNGGKILMELYTAAFLEGRYMPRCVDESAGCIKIADVLIPGAHVASGMIKESGKWFAISGTERNHVEELVFKPELDENAECSSGTSFRRPFMHHKCSERLAFPAPWFFSSKQWR